jgi:protein TIF31
VFQLGENHERTKDSSECLAHLTKQAVVVQKKMNEIYKGEMNTTFPPIQVDDCYYMKVVLKQT